MGVAMPGWVRNAVMLAVTAVWAAYIAGSLWNGGSPPAAVWAVPGVTYVSLVGGLGGIGKRVRVVVDDEPAEKPERP